MGDLRGLHSVAPFGARPAAPFTLKASCKLRIMARPILPPCHHATPCAPPPCHYAKACHLATIAGLQRASTPPNQRESPAISKAWLGPYHNKDYAGQAFCLSALQPPRHASPATPAPRPAATAATAQAEGVGPPIPPCALQPYPLAQIVQFVQYVSPYQN